MRTRGLWIALRLTVALLARLAPASAHEDPRGDVRPTVVAVNNRFEVYFSNNLCHEAGSEDPVYRKLFSAAGEKLGVEDRYIGDIPQTETQYRFIADLVQGRPVLPLTRRFGNHTELTKPQLPPGRYDDCCSLGWVTDSTVAMRDSPPRPKDDSTWPFSLRLVEIGSGKLLGSTRLGTPARIYDFAVTSTVLSARDEVLIAWLETKKLADVEMPDADGNLLRIGRALYRMVLTRWQPSTGKTRHVEIAPVGSGNVAVSIGRIGSVVLVAWHERGEIRAEAIDLKTAPFAARLPELSEGPADPAPIAPSP